MVLSRDEAQLVLLAVDNIEKAALTPAEVQVLDRVKTLLGNDATAAAPTPGQVKTGWVSASQPFALLRFVATMERLTHLRELLRQWWTGLYGHVRMLSVSWISVLVPDDSH